MMLCVGLGCFYGEKRIFIEGIPGPPIPMSSTEPVFLNVYGAPELIARNEFRQPM